MEEKTAMQGPASALGAEIEAGIAELAPWFHNLHLPNGIRTAPHHPLGDFPRYKWEELASALPEAEAPPDTQ